MPVYLGEEAEVTIDAYKMSPNPNIANLSPADRECRFPHETQGLQILKVYTKEGCQFECSLRKARELCGCTPWNYPFVPGKKNM